MKKFLHIFAFSFVVGSSPIVAETCNVPGAVASWPDQDRSTVLTILGGRLVLITCHVVTIGERFYLAEVASINHNDLVVHTSGDGMAYLDWGGLNLGTPKFGICGTGECSLFVNTVGEFPDPIYILRIETSEHRQTTIEFAERDPPLLHRVF